MNHPETQSLEERIWAAKDRDASNQEIADEMTQSQ